MADTTHPNVQGHGPTAAGHVMPFKVLVRVWGSLLALTLLTVLVAGVDLGRLNLEIALAIAVVKASLVLLFFMHMRYDRPMNAIVFIAALLFFMLFVTLALLDSHAYAPELIPGYAPALAK
jgi:cytochrome c oxidase subunit 4